TEGGTAAIVYIFNSLKENKLIKQGDKIAINTPIFTPYLQIPELNDYEMVEVDLRSDEEHNWEIQASELDKLKDPEIKAFFAVNPSNPGAMAFDDTALE
ncbi:aminotransferase class I/II-fold pyridoxal phosphate-dependent enzyme, partial [Enterococcus sp. S181_ASV_20]|nr:aminotransferase class I/II-fold pyridoxal phosphate-dependent enzyme [Enterococcus sp. S181_ASV_20]